MERLNIWFLFLFSFLFSFFSVLFSLFSFLFFFLFSLFSFLFSLFSFLFSLFSFLFSLFSFLFSLLFSFSKSLSSPHTPLPLFLSSPLPPPPLRYYTTTMKYVGKTKQKKLKNLKKGVERKMICLCGWRGGIEGGGQGWGWRGVRLRN